MEFADLGLRDNVAIAAVFQVCPWCASRVPVVSSSRLPGALAAPGVPHERQSVARPLTSPQPLIPWATALRKIE